MPWRGPRHPGDFPSLGWGVVDWIEENVVVPLGPLAGQPLRLTPEQVTWLVKFYRVHPVTGRRWYRRGCLSRPRGWGKSPVAAAMCLAEFDGPVTHDGWDAEGEPVGVRWRTPLVQIVGVSEDQAENTWRPLLEMIRNGPLADAPYIDPGLQRVVKAGGKMEPVTAEGKTRKGAQTTFAVLDQTELWDKANGGVRLFEMMRDNTFKTGGSFVETPNAYVPGLQSVAQATAEAAAAQREGRTKLRDILYDHREAPPETVLSDRDSLLAGLAFAYGDAADVNGGWVSMEHALATVWDPQTDVQQVRRDLLNQITAAEDSWISAQQWGKVAQPGRTVPDGSAITVGFDGSLSDDATALVGCEVATGYLWLIGLWEPAERVEGWTVPHEEVDAVLHQTFQRYDVRLMLADPPHWQDYLRRWQAEYGDSTVRAYWTNRYQDVVRSLELMHTDVLRGALSHSGQDQLTRHVLNARRRMSRSGLMIGKEFPGSPRKMDAAMAAMIAYRARSEVAALVEEVGPPPLVLGM